VASSKNYCDANDRERQFGGQKVTYQQCYDKCYALYLDDDSEVDFFFYTAAWPLDQNGNLRSPELLSQYFDGDPVMTAKCTCCKFRPKVHTSSMGNRLYGVEFGGFGPKCQWFSNDDPVDSQNAQLLQLNVSVESVQPTSGSLDAIPMLGDDREKLRPKAVQPRLRQLPTGDWDYDDDDVFEGDIYFTGAGPSPPSPRPCPPASPPNWNPEEPVKVRYSSTDATQENYCSADTRERQFNGEKRTWSECRSKCDSLRSNADSEVDAFFYTAASPSGDPVMTATCTCCHFRPKVHKSSIGNKLYGHGWIVGPDCNLFSNIAFSGQRSTRVA